jgi:hypothetical protein
MYRTAIAARGRESADRSRGVCWIHLRTVLTVVVVVGLLAVGCAGPTPARTVAASSPSDAQARMVYRSQSFVVPFEVTVPSWLPVAADQDRPNFVTWDRPGEPAVRVMVPVATYPPGSAAAIAPPTDFVGYVTGLTTAGASVADRAEITVGGRPATIVTATTSRHLDGTLGCPEPQQSAPDCFGLQPDLSLRLAVVPLEGTTLLIWLRTPVDTDTGKVADRVTSFEQMLASLRFTDPTPRPSPSAPPAAGVTPIDGVWSATWTYQELKDSPLLYEGELNDENWGTYTMTFSNGTGSEAVRNPKFHGKVPLTYRVDGDVVTITKGNDQFVMRWAISGDQLQLIRDDALGGSPTPYVIRPFTRHA